MPLSAWTYSAPPSRSTAVHFPVPPPPAFPSGRGKRSGLTAGLSAALSIVSPDVGIDSQPAIPAAANSKGQPATVNGFIPSTAPAGRWLSTVRAPRDTLLRDKPDT